MSPPPVSQSDEVITTVSTPDALKLAEIQAMRQLGDAVAAQTKQYIEHASGLTRAIEKLSDKVDDVRERVITLEQSGYDKRLEALKSAVEKVDATAKSEKEKLEARINQLESERDQVKGAASLTTWLAKNAPWLLAVLFAAAAGIGFKFPR